MFSSIFGTFGNKKGLCFYCTVLFVLLLLSYPLFSQDQNNAEIPVPVLIDGINTGELTVRINLDQQEQISLPKEEILSLLETRVSEKEISEIRTFYEFSNWIPMEVLAKTGLTAEFDSSLLTLSIEIPPDLRREQALTLRKERNLPAYEAVYPSTFSAYVNVLGSVSMTADSQGTEFPYTLNADGALNLFSWVLEGGVIHGYQTPEEGPYVKADQIRLVKDFIKPKLRMYVGDLTYPLQGFQSYLQLQGVSVSRIFSLDRDYKRPSPGTIPVFLSNPSKVEVFVNGKNIKTLHLEAGSYSLEDFIVFNGINTIELVITDSFGRESRETVTLPFSSDLLPKGSMAFSYSLGIPRFLLAVPKLTAFHSYGITDFLTSGLNIQLDMQQQLIGLNILAALRFGILSADTALSIVQDIGTDFAVRIQYRYTNLNKPGIPVFWLSGMYQGKKFGVLGNLQPNNRYSFDFSGNMSFKLPKGFSLGLGSRYKIGREENPNETTISLTGAKAFPKATSLRIGIDYTFGSEQTVPWKGYISVSTNPEGSRQIINAKQDLNSGKGSINWNMRSKKRIGGFSTSAGIQGVPFDDDSNQSIFAGVNYPGYRFLADVSNTLTRRPEEEDSPVENRTNLRLGTAFVFAGKKFGITAPVQDSFAIIAPSENLKGRFLGVNPSSGYYSAQTGRLGSAVISDLRSNTYEDIIIEAPDLPVGLELGNSAFTFLPGYRSGIVINAGTEASVFAQGILQSGESPVPLEAGEVRSIDEPGSDNILFFTGREGEFQIYGLQPGEWELELYEYPGRIYRFIIPADVYGLFDLGTAFLPEDGN